MLCEHCANTVPFFARWPCSATSAKPSKSATYPGIYLTMPSCTSTPSSLTGKLCSPPHVAPSVLLDQLDRFERGGVVYAIRTMMPYAPGGVWILLQAPARTVCAHTPPARARRAHK